MLESTMQDFPLDIGMILRHGRTVFGDSEVVTFEGDSCRRAPFADISRRVDRLAGALRRLGIEASDRVATFQWNNQEHLEAYLAIPTMGAVLHTLNIRLFPEQLTYVANHAEDRIVLVDDTLVPLLARVAPDLKTVEHYVVVGDGDASALADAVAGADVLRYDELLASEDDEFPWPDVDERSAAAMCYTSGTTGNPKGVVYSHRSTVLHSMGVNSGGAVGLTENDRVLPIVPMFHANAWGLPYAAWFAGASFVMPDRFLQAEPLAKLIESERPTIAGAVPTIWSDLLRHAADHPVDLSSFRLVVCGGSAVPRSLMERFEQDAGNPLPWDGDAVGEIEVRGPWVTGSYYLDPSPDKFDNGWLRTGDVGCVSANGFIQITDRAKDVIKSGGEWISTVELENNLMAHPDIVEAAVIGVPDPRWHERPLACVVCAEGSAVSAADLQAFLADKIAKWQVPERWVFIEEVPKTSVGKFDKKVLRARHSGGELDIEELT
jgi:acyl-CoA synthetase (AMP-forming)/AMP-acid ligase II